MNKETLKKLVNENIVCLNDDTFDSLERLMLDTLKTNEKFNLTAITNENEFRELMLYDSLLPLKYFDFSNKKVIDIGTGAGYPGLPLAISSKGKFTLLDATAKKINHITEYVKNNSILNVVAISSRAEEYARKHLEEYDYVIARAVSSLNILLELCIPLLKIGGTMLAMKGGNFEEEINESQKALKTLGCSIEITYLDKLPDSQSERALIVIKKEKKTNKKYPRNYSDIKNKTL